MRRRDVVLDADDLFLRSVSAIRDHLKNRQLGVSQSARWRIELRDEAVVSVSLPTADLGRNLQTDAAAAPCFALFLAWWFERLKLFGERRVRVRVEVLGAEVPHTPDGRRALFVLNELALMLPERFECAAAAKMRWPAKPTVRAITADNYVTSHVFGVERQIETVFVGQPGLADQFAPIDRIEGFRRFPSLGLFDESEGTAMRKGPAGRSQTHLSAMSIDGRTAHVFTLKDLGNSRFGIIPEALWLARLLHRIRTSDLGGAAQVGGEEISPLRRTERIATWLLVQDIHPFLRSGDDTPLLWFRAAMKGHGLTLGVLPYEHNRKKESVRLLIEQRWT